MDTDVILTGCDPALSVLWPIWLEISVEGLPAGNSLNEPALLIAYPVPPPGASARYTGFAEHSASSAPCRPKSPQKSADPGKSDSVPRSQSHTSSAEWPAPPD